MNQSDPHHEIAQLENEIEKLRREQTQCADQMQRLLESEAAGEGSRAGEIHRLKQRKMMLGTQMQHLRAKIGAMKLGII
jgi:predicted  nucleic acid-binding Zn-ribbon protein